MSIALSDAWVLAGVLFDTPEAVKQLDELPEPWRAIGEKLAESPQAARHDLWDAIKLGLPDRDAIQTALDSVDHLEPQPESETTIEAVDSWGPLRIYDPPEVEPFPIDVLPRAVADLVAEAAMAIGSPCDFIAVPALAVAGGAVGRSVALMLKRGYFASSAIWGVSVGLPGDGKSPALAAAAEPLRRIGRVLALEHEQAKDRMKADAERVGSNGSKARPEPPPKPRRISLDDTTTEALIGLMADNPRGLTMVRDELSALLLGMNQYKPGGKGSDQPTYCKIWSGSEIQRDRVSNENHEPIRCPHPFLAIAGCLTPDLLGELTDAKGRSDGFSDRFLFTYPNAMPSPPWSNAGIPDDVADGWAVVVERLWARSVAESDGRSVPNVARMTPRGEAAWRSLHGDHSDEMNDAAFPPSMRGPWAKLREYAGRLALVLALLDHAANPTVDAAAVPDVNERHVANAWRLVAYFKPHARRVYSVVNLGVAGPESAAAKAVVSWLQAGGRGTFTERDAKRARSWIEPDAMLKALSYLAKSNAIRPHEAPQATDKGGRPPSPVYDVNPALYL